MAILQHIDGALLVVQCDEHNDSSDTTICDCKPEGSQLNDCEFRKFDISNNTHAEVRVDTVESDDVKWDNRNFKEVTIGHCNFKDVQFVNCNFHNVKFYKFNLTKVRFENLDLQDVKFLHSFMLTKSRFPRRLDKYLTLTSCEWRNMRIANAVFSRMEFPYTIERQRSMSKTALEVTGEQCSYGEKFQNHIRIGCKYETGFEGVLRNLRCGHRSIYDRLVPLLFPKTLVLFRKLPRDQSRTFRRDDRFTDLGRSNGDVTVEIVHLRPGVSLATDPSTQSISERVGSIDHKRVRLAQAKHPLDGLKFSMGLICVNFLFFNLLQDALLDHVFAFQCSADITEGILKR